ncbi:MAG: metallophosphoesterase [Alistipes sp.]|nr:metallophosphoesterase [Alistipes sp.]MDE7129301.1 metallophosphoesterase [Alistipes sp.]
MLLSLSAVPAAEPLRFSDDGRFKIVQFTDAHVRCDKPDEMAKTVDRLEWIIAEENPDLVVFTGDVVTGRPAVKAWRAILAPVAKSGVPFVVVYGNHDREQDLKETELAQVITAFPNSLNIKSDDRLADMAVEVLARDGDSVAAVLYCLDSHDYSTVDGIKGYGWIGFDQIDWYRKLSRAYTAANGGRPLPSYAFFHIPLPEYAEACAASEKSVRGIRREDECAPKINTGMFAAMKECGDVVATFVGHDHDNDYIVPFHGIALVYGHYSGDNTVYNHLWRGVRVIELRESERNFRTWIRHRDNRKIDDVIFDAKASKLRDAK